MVILGVGLRHTRRDWVVSGIGDESLVDTGEIGTYWGSLVLMLQRGSSEMRGSVWYWGGTGACWELLVVMGFGKGMQWECLGDIRGDWDMLGGLVVFLGG